MKKIHALTGLRGLAAMIVFISHSANAKIFPSVFGQGFGQVGVMLFFVLSGFLMAHLYINLDFDKTHISRYVFARIARVVPLYLAVLFGSVIISNFIWPEFYFDFSNPADVINAGLFLSAPYVFWTIPVEVHFYVIFIILWYLHKNKNWTNLHFALVTALSIIPSAVYFLLNDRIPDVITSYSYAFMLGLFVAELYKNTSSDWSEYGWLTNPLAIVFLFLVFANLPELRKQLGWYIHDGAFALTWIDPITWVSVLGLFVLALMNTRSLSFLSSRPFTAMGHISFSFYLIHHPIVVHVTYIDVPPAMQFVLAFCFTFIASAILFFLFERPIGYRIRALSRRFDIEQQSKT